MFKKILIANRGEIACRVIVTARRMGIATVAVHSDADRDARHVTLADEAVSIGPAPSRESYLRAERIIEACKATGAEAVHPGYGFLSENAEFARRVEEEGIVFIGPKHGSIAAMGDKIASKKLALAAKVNTIPGWNDVIESAERAVAIARDIGYPVMIKASAGGGGKGLRVAGNDKEAFDGFDACRNEARSAFGDDRVFIEKFVEQPRHIEIQVLGDAHGNAVWLGERECSLQRRHQKVIEEAPSPFIGEATRRAMGEQAVALARAVDYQSAGTVEFVVGADESFYFLEMNTRLQVEHPVTECVTGLDLVEQMIRVAAGEPLGFGQHDIRRDGWAIECRINAEDPSRGFLPSSGRLVRYQPPRETLRAAEPKSPMPLGVRVDTGVYEGGEIPMHYDSMIAKLIVHGSDRADAVSRMREALDAFVVRGVACNIAFQSALLAHPRFQAGDFNTGFIAEQFPHGLRADDAAPAEPGFLVALLATIHRRYLSRAAGITGQLPGHGYRVGDDFVAVVSQPGGGVVEHAVTVTGNSFDRRADGLGDRTATACAGGQVYRFEIVDWAYGQVRVEGRCDGQPFVAQIERRGLSYTAWHHGVRLDALLLAPRAAELQRLMPVKAAPDTSKLLLSPMPGLLVEVCVRPGQQVTAGERLATVEAMKMENVLAASVDATVEEVLAKAGDSLAVDQPIMRFR